MAVVSLVPARGRLLPAWLPCFMALSIERPEGSGGSVKAMQVDFTKAADLWDEVQASCAKSSPARKRR